MADPSPSKTRKNLTGFLIVAAIVAVVLVLSRLTPPTSAPETAEQAQERMRLEAQLAEDRETARRAQERLREHAESARAKGIDPASGRGTPEPPVTLSEYRRIRAGMSYREVVGIIGESGEEMSRTSIPGLPTTVMYGWQNPDGSGMNAMFQGGSLIQKAQFRLR